MNRLNSAVQELRRESPTDGIDAAVDSFRPLRRRNTRTWWLAGGITVSMSIAASMLALPVRSEARRLHEVEEAIRQARIRHIVTYRAAPPDAGKTVSEVWAAGNRYRLTIGGPASRSSTWIVFDGNRRYTFDPRQKRVVVSEDGGNEQKWDTMSELAEALKSDVPERTIHMEEIVREKRKMLRLTMDSFFETHDPKQGTFRFPIKTVWLADAQDKLPREVLHYQTYHPTSHGPTAMRLAFRGTIDYPKQVPKGAFDAGIPAGWKVVTLKPTSGTKGR